MFDACAAAIEKLPFLRAWKEGGAGRRICLDAVGTTGYSETGMDAFVLPAWTDSGLAGDPEFELLLRQGDSWARIFISSAADGAILEHAGDLFPDAQRLDFHPQNPEYGVIHPDGRIERRRVSPR